MPKKSGGIKKATTKSSPTQKNSFSEPAERTGPRRLSLPARHWYNPLTWRYSPPVPAYKPIPKARKLFAATLHTLWRNWKLFGGIVLIYGVLNALLVRSAATSATNLHSLKDTLDQLVHGFGGHVLSAFGSFTFLVASSGGGSGQSSSFYQYILLLICSLAFVWALRQAVANNTARVRDSFYLGMYPLIPFFLVFLVLCIQLIPLAMSGTMLSLVASNGIAVNGWQMALFIAIFIGFSLWSLRMVTGTLLALYIVTLPNMTPMRALRTAKKLVYGRRLLLWRKFIFLPVILLLLAAVIEIPVILLVTPVAPWLFFVISMICLPIVHGYMYTLYREAL